MIKDIKCLLPYNEILINALKIAICDPISDVRTIAAKAFGSLARKLGEANSGRIIEVLKGKKLKIPFFLFLIDIFRYFGASGFEK